MDNLKLIDGKFNILLNKNIYILDHSAFSYDNNLSFNISGMMVLNLNLKIKMLVLLAIFKRKNQKPK